MPNERAVVWRRLRASPPVLLSARHASVLPTPTRWRLAVSRGPPKFPVLDPLEVRWTHAGSLSCRLRAWGSPDKSFLSAAVRKLVSYYC